MSKYTTFEPFRILFKFTFCHVRFVNGIDKFLNRLHFLGIIFEERLNRIAHFNYMFICRYNFSQLKFKFLKKKMFYNRKILITPN